MRCAAADILHQCSHKIGPLVPGELDGRDGGDNLGGSLAGLGIIGSEGLQREALDPVFGFLVGLLEPFGL